MMPPMEMRLLRCMSLAMGLAIAISLSSPLSAQSPPPATCTDSQAAAVQCFVANTVATGLTQPRYGITLAQFQDYGVAVTKILQTDQIVILLRIPTQGTISERPT
jgi:hypothetical protein